MVLLLEIITIIINLPTDIDNNGFLDSNDFECMALRACIIEGKGDFTPAKLAEYQHIMHSLWEEISDMADFDKVSKSNKCGFIHRYIYIHFQTGGYERCVLFLLLTLHGYEQLKCRPLTLYAHLHIFICVYICINVHLSD